MNSFQQFLQIIYFNKIELRPAPTTKIQPIFLRAWQILKGTCDFSQNIFSFNSFMIISIIFLFEILIKLKIAWKIFQTLLLKLHLSSFFGPRTTTLNKENTNDYTNMDSYKSFFVVAFVFVFVPITTTRNMEKNADEICSIFLSFLHIVIVLVVNNNFCFNSTNCFVVAAFDIDFVFVTNATTKSKVNNGDEDYSSFLSFLHIMFVLNSIKRRISYSSSIHKKKMNLIFDIFSIFLILSIDFNRFLKSS